MAEGPVADTAATAAADAAAARAAEQARLRKERREAKLKAGGSARLNKITGLGGGVQRDPEPTASDRGPAVSAAGEIPSAETGAHHEDPAEVDISEHFYEPRRRTRASQPTSAIPPVDPSNMTESQLQQLMLGFDRPMPGMGPRGGQFTDGNPASGGPAGDDPILKLLSQMMGSGAQGPGLFGMANPSAQGAAARQQQAAASATPDRYAVIWRVLHAVLAVGLGLLIVFSTSFNGTKLERESAAAGPLVGQGTESASLIAGPSGKPFFFVFATAEAILLTTRFFLDRAREPPSGLLWAVVGVLPPPFKAYVETTLRYGQILSTVRTDLLICVFLLGISSWVRGV